MKNLKYVFFMMLFTVLLIGCASEISTPQTNQPPLSASIISPTAQTIEDIEIEDGTDENTAFAEGLPTDLPENYILKEILNTLEMQTFTAQYVWDDPKFTGEMIFISQELQKPEANWDPETEIETGKVGECDATFIRGNWWEGIWEKEAPVYRIQWAEEGVFYTILYFHNETSSQGYLNKEDLTELAQQMCGNN